MLDLVFRNSTKERTYGPAFFERVLNKIIKQLKIKYRTVEVSINIVGDAKIRSLNRKYRRKNSVTDVLSFPLGETYGKGYTGVILGDIFICISHVKKRAVALNIPIEKYLSWVVVHGILHLVGHDHEESKQKAIKMFALEKKLLKKV
jgi:probable rRNA maturation factor